MMQNHIEKKFREPTGIWLFSALILLTMTSMDARAQQTFADVSPDHWAFQFIESMSANGITSGCGGGNYCPTDSVTRAQMAVFLLRAKHGSNYSPPAATGVFPDVPGSNFAIDWIEQLAAEGITSGCGGGNYCPDDPVTRAQMAVFLLRAKYGSGYAPPEATGLFPDVPASNFAIDWIEQLAAEGITSGCGGGNYCPSDAVSRDQMAVFLVRTFNLAIILPSQTLIWEEDNWDEADWE